MKTIMNPNTLNLSKTNNDIANSDAHTINDKVCFAMFFFINASKNSLDCYYYRLYI
jgi:hypothetical protein